MMEDRFRDIRALARVMKADYDWPATQGALALRPTGRNARTFPFRGKGASVIAGHVEKKGGGKTASAVKDQKGKGKTPALE